MCAKAIPRTPPRSDRPVGSDPGASRAPIPCASVWTTVAFPGNTGSCGFRSGDRSDNRTLRTPPRLCTRRRPQAYPSDRDLSYDRRVQCGAVGRAVLLEHLEIAGNGVADVRLGLAHRLALTHAAGQGRHVCDLPFVVRVICEDDQHLHSSIMRGYGALTVGRDRL